MKLSKFHSVFLYILLISGYSSVAQELNCRIQVNSSQIQTTDKSVYDELQKALFEFINNKTWTSNVFTMDERIDCAFLLTITKQIATDEFQASLQVTSTRPVYNSAYDSPMINLIDKNVQFTYAEGQALTFSENAHDELTSLFAFYIYYILGVDYDSFSNLGGTPYFEKAEKIVSNAQSSQYKGWKSVESKKNRYWLAENYLNAVYNPVREYSYTYHRLSLDIMNSKASDARTNIATNLSPLLKLQREKPSSYIMQLFFDAKSDELIKILSESPSSEKIKAYNILKEVDPGHLSKYEELKKSSN